MQLSVCPSDSSFLKKKKILKSKASVFSDTIFVQLGTDLA